MAPPTEKTILSVSQLNRKVKQLLEIHLPLVWISGEVSNFAQPGSGHWYFSLKDEKAQVRCAMFKPANQRLRWQPESGSEVLIRARVSLYEGRGEFQLIVEHMEDTGVGAMQRAYEALKLKLEREGLFDSEHKRPLPQFPKHIGVITSPTGAAIRDILWVFQRRYPIAEVTIIPVAVQGDSAAVEMTQALAKAERFGRFDLLIIGRGGGSIEDLWAFNNEALARTIYHCSVPIISAVGHEVDFTICDFVADERAATPSAGAEMVTPDLGDWRQSLDIWQQQLIQCVQEKLYQKQQELEFLKRCLRHPGEQLANQKLRVQALTTKLVYFFEQRLISSQQQLFQLTNRLQQNNPRYAIGFLRQQSRQLRHQLDKAMKQGLLIKKQHLSSCVQLLDAVSPLRVIDRGYSIVSENSGAIIKDVKNIRLGQTLTTRLATGSFTSQVSSIRSEES